MRAPSSPTSVRWLPSWPIVSSFFGHYLGAREGLKGMIVQNMRSSGKAPNHKKVELFIIAFFILTLWGVAVINPPSSSG